MQFQKLTVFHPYLIYFGVFTANMLSFTTGVTFNWASTIVPHLKSNDTSINPLPKPLTTLESSWIVSISVIGSLVGPCIGGILITKLGKKKFILLLGIPVFIGNLIMAFATSVWMFLVARVTIGITVGCCLPVMTSYVGDIAEDHNRGLLGMFTTVFISIGGLFVYAVGPFISVKLFSLLTLIPLIILFIVFGLFVPDTPFALLQNNSTEEARKSLAFYRGKTLIEIDTEFEKLLENARSKQEEKKVTSLEQLRTVYRSQPLFKGLKLVEAIFLLGGFTGMAAVANYYQTIFDEASGSLESTYSCMIIGVVTLFSTVLTSQLVERLGRKLLLLTGCIFTGLSLFSLATYFLLKSKGYDIEPISWLPLASLIIYTMAYNVQGGIPWILLTDIFPSDVLDVSAAIASITMWSLAFIISLLYPYAKDWLGNYGVFFVFACGMAFTIVFISLFVPETKGKSIEEVQALLSKEK